jgi:metallo-beta-lactamase family protein
MKPGFDGADREVTGSCHLVVLGGMSILIDCGVYQADRELMDENRKPLGFESDSIDFLLLTHAHVEHCGRSLLLMEHDIRGELVTAAATRELARLVMLDWWHGAPRPETTALVHGDPDAMQSFCKALPDDAAVVMPSLNEELVL